MDGERCVALVVSGNGGRGLGRNKVVRKDQVRTNKT